VAQVANDELGSGGGFLGALGSVLTQGLSGAVDGALSKKFGVGYSNGQVMVDAYGNPRPAGAAATPVSAAEGIAGALRNPYVLGGVALGIALLAFAALRK